MPRAVRSVLAIARQDLLHELRGRRGYVLASVTALLLAPISTAPIPEYHPPPDVFTVTGDVPDAVRALPNVAVTEAGHAQAEFVQPTQGPLIVRAKRLTREARVALDGGVPVIDTRSAPREVPIPRRSLLIALLSAAVLTGSVSESIGGERSRHTLETLLVAAVRREQVVLGKWLAWAAVGGTSALLSAAVAIAFGRLPLGLWLIAVPLVAAQAVALGLFLMRFAKDALTGATVTMRWMPVALGASTLFTWRLGLDHPWLAAFVPLGGAAIAAGNTFSGAFVPLACIGAVGWTALLIELTAIAIGQDPPPLDPVAQRFREVATSAALAFACIQPGIIGPFVWIYAQRPDLVPTGSVTAGLATAATALFVLTGLRWLRHDRPPPRIAEAWTAREALVAVALAAASFLPLPALYTAGNASLLERVDLGLHPLAGGTLAGGALLVAQEVFFRGWLLRHVGVIGATAAWVAAVGLHDPLYAALSGVALALFGSRGAAPLTAAIALRLALELAR